MLCFTVNRNGHSAAPVNLAGSYVVGSDSVPLRADLELKDDQIVCAKRSDGPAGVALLWPVTGCGAILMETSRLVERSRPYNLALELARSRLMRINQKREEWGLFDFDGIEPVADEITKARDLFVEALKADEDREQTRLAEQALQLAFIAGEQLTHFHADLFLNRRRQSLGFGKRNVGCTVELSNATEAYRIRFKEGFDYAYLPLSWRVLEPKQGEFNWRLFDGWVEFLAKNRIPIKAGPLVRFHERHLPDWVGMYEPDFETVRNLLFEHVRRVVERYGQYVHQWDVISGIHAENTFEFTFEQIMEMTRVTSSLVKQLAPRAQTVVDLVALWGEYYARNQRTIPPLLYADMVVQSGIAFDAFGVQFVFGAPVDGMFVRDMMQISEKLDRVGSFGKPVHVTAVQAPSSSVGEGTLAGGGSWWKPWSEQLQARWIKEFFAVAFSKPFVESITWKDLADRPQATVPSGGLCNADLTPKAAFKVIKDYRAVMLNATRRPPGTR